jgi:hypothetical protein
LQGREGSSRRIKACACTKLASQPLCETLQRDIARNSLGEGEDMADDDALFQKGMPIRREVLGAEYVDASMARADEFMMSFQRATTAQLDEPCDAHCPEPGARDQAAR